MVDQETTPNVSSDEADSIPPELNDAKFLFVRHAQSLANIASSPMNQSLIDAELSPEGIQQCQESETYQYLQEMNFDQVLVSPLRRAMLTAYNLLKDHPSFATIKFVIAPHLRENMSGNSDVPMPYSTTVAFARTLFPTVDTTTYFDNFDESDGTRETYFLEHLDQRPMSQIKALIKRQPEESVASHVCNVQRDHYYPKRMESVSMMKFRAQLFKN